MEITVTSIVAIAIVVIVVLLVFAVPFWWISTSNDFKRKIIKVGEGLSDVEVALTNRYDILTKLLDATKGFTTHEKTLLTQIVAMRRGMSVGELNKANEQADDLASRINVMVEAYPELRSSDVVRELQAGISDTEKHLQAARRLYNSNVAAFNSAIVVFPANIVANAQRLEQREFFTADANKFADVEMKL